MLRGLRRHERTLAVAYLAAVAGALALWLVPGVRGWVSVQAKKVSYRAEAAWALRVDAAVTRLGEGDLEAAEAMLLRLDRRLPARHIKHGLASQRARVLEAMARVHRAKGRKGRTLATLRRLTAFEPRNFAFHALHGEVAAELGELEEAREAWARVLAIHPNHLPTVRRVVQDHADRGDAAGAVAAYERYLDAWGMVQLVRGGEPQDVWVQADGAPHTFLLDPGSGELAAAAPLETLERRVDPDGRERATLRVFKPVDATLWDTVRRACRNLTDWDRLARLEARTRVQEPPADAFAGDPT